MSCHFPQRLVERSNDHLSAVTLLFHPAYAHWEHSPPIQMQGALPKYKLPFLLISNREVHAFAGEPFHPSKNWEPEGIIYHDVCRTKGSASEAPEFNGTASTFQIGHSKLYGGGV